MEKSSTGSYNGEAGYQGIVIVRGPPDNGTIYFTYDANGNTTDLIPANSNSPSHFSYDPFGNLIDSSGPDATNCPFLFSSKMYDDVTGQVLYERRPYGPSWGRFGCKDPIGEEGGLNLYGFVNNDPVRRIDPNGESILVWAIIAAAIEAAWDTTCANIAATEGRAYGLSFHPCHRDFDKHGHCYGACVFNRCKLGLSPFLTALYSAIYNSSEHHNSWSEWSSHVNADMTGIINSYKFKSCASSCTKCP